MIWNDTLLYIHVPKTGGMSVSHRLLQKLTRPVTCSVPEGQYEGPDDVRIIEGTRHESLGEAVELLGKYGIRLEHFPLIIATIRNPYAMEVSRYFYLRKGHPMDEGEEQRLALDMDFEHFATHSSFWGRASAGVDRWILIDGQKPKNLILVRQEALEVELHRALDHVGLGDLAWHLPKENVTKHDHFVEYLTPLSEGAIYERYTWLFETGLYKRHLFA